MRRTARLWLLPLLLLGVAIPAAAQSTQEEEDPFAEAFFDPELVMQNRQRVGITDEQWGRISSSLRELQREAVDLEWQMLEVAQELIEISTPDQVDEEAALDAVRRMFEVENEIKVIQMQMLIRIKNVLTPRQQNELRRIRGGI